MIPKKIHYCWFGRSEKPKMALKCIASWKKFCPDYEIIEWNEDNFDIFSYPYAQYCYEQKKWAFLSDFVRLVVVEKYGGVYFDTDVEVVRSLDELLTHEAFYGFENEQFVNTGEGFGSQAHHVVVESMLQLYLALKPNRIGEYEIVSCPNYNTQALLPLGLTIDGRMQNVRGALIFPIEYFNPYDDSTGRLNKTANTFSIHWYSKSWLSKTVILRSKLTKPFHRMFGKNCFTKLKEIIGKRC